MIQFEVRKVDRRAGETRPAKDGRSDNGEAIARVLGNLMDRMPPERWLVGTER